MRFLAIYKDGSTKTFHEVNWHDIMRHVDNETLSVAAIPENVSDGHFVIFNYSEKENNTPLYWNNKDGWGDLSSADVFTTEETETFRLPMQGEWIKLPTFI